MGRKLAAQLRRSFRRREIMQFSTLRLLRCEVVSLVMTRSDEWGDTFKQTVLRWTPLAEDHIKLSQEQTLGKFVLTADVCKLLLSAEEQEG